MKKLILSLFAVVAFFIAPAQKTGSSTYINGSGTADYIPKFTASKKLGNSTILEGSHTLTFIGETTLGNISTYPYFWFNKGVKTSTNYSICHNSNYLIFNTGALPILIRRNNTDGLGGEPLLDFGASLIPNIIKFNSYCGIGVSAGKLLLNTDTGLDVQIGTFNGSTVTSKFEFKSSNGVFHMSACPTSSVGLISGDVYSNSGILTIVP